MRLSASLLFVLVGGVASVGACASDADAPDASPAAAGGGSGSSGAAGAGGGSATSGRFPACDASATKQTLTFVHVNDLHAGYTRLADGTSPVAHLRGYFREVSKESPYTLFTNGGDDYEKGSVAEQLSQGRASREVVQGLKFDVRVVGNHDFAWGQQEILADSHDPFALVVSSNIRYIGDDPAGFGARDFATLQVGCVKVGFFGLTSGPWDSRDQPLTSDFYPEFPTSFDYVGVAKSILEKHRSEVDVMILVSHLGVTGDPQVVAGAPGIDAVLGGHSHTLLFTPLSGGPAGAPIIQAGSFARAVARLDLTIDLATKKVVDQTYAVRQDISALPVDAEAQAMVDHVFETYAPHASDTIGTAKSDGTKSTMAAVLARAAKTTLATDAALIDIGTAWDRWKAGPISAESAIAAFKVEREPPGTPGFNAIYTAKVTGASLVALSKAPASTWAFVGPNAIDPAKTYSIAVQKRAALNVSSDLPAGATLVDAPAFQSEAWAVLETYAKARTTACQYVDVDESIPGCTP